MKKVDRVYLNKKGKLIIQETMLVHEQAAIRDKDASEIAYISMFVA